MVKRYACADALRLDGPRRKQIAKLRSNQFSERGRIFDAGGRRGQVAENSGIIRRSRRPVFSSDGFVGDTKFRARAAWR
jgi:hypothetical protein